MSQDVLDSLLWEWRQQLCQWSRSGALRRAALDALVLPGEPEPLRQWLTRWSLHDFRDLPPVVVLPASAMPAAMAAYATRTDTIYLNEDGLRTGSREGLLAVLTEELGHHLDASLNATDTPGDEGELFAALLTGDGTMGEQRRQSLRAQEDRSWVRLGKEMLVGELAARVVRTPSPATIPWRSSGEYRNESAFAALRTDGSVVSWGYSLRGGESSSVKKDLANVVAFADPFTDDQWVLGDPMPRVTLALSPAAVAEDGPANLVYTFARSADPSSPLTVSFKVGGTATLGIDYTGIAAAGTTKQVTFAAGSATATVLVDPTADTTKETNETVALTLVPGSGYTIETANAVVGTILNDDPRITLGLSPAAVTEDGSSNLIYTFTRTGSLTSALRIFYTVGGTAQLGVDYTGIASAGSSKSVVFAAGSATAQVTVDPKADSTIEADETVEITLAPGSGYTVDTLNPVTGTIRNDDLPRVTLALSPAAVQEDGPGLLTYTFTRTGPTTEALSVVYNVGGSATLGVDYTGIVTPGASQTIAFAPGSATTKLLLDPTADPHMEADETVALTLVAGSGYTIGTPSTVSATIKNDDTRLLLANASLPSLPSQQGWLSFGAGFTGSENRTTSGTTLLATTQMADGSGYSNHLATAPQLVNISFPPLDRSVGVALDFQLQLLRERHVSTNRAGFSVTLLDQGPTPRGIELGFWTNSLFSQAGGEAPFQAIAEQVDGIDTTLPTTYSLRLLDQSYFLLAGNRLVLSGPAQDYSQWAKDPLLPFHPYTTPNFLFLGDNSRSAEARVELGTVALSVPLTGGNASETLNGTAAADQLNGLAGADRLNGNAGDDWLAGGLGNDTLYGGAGDDLLIGGRDADRFLFSSGASFRTSLLGVDTIVDFNPAEDRLRLARATFPKLLAGPRLDAAAFAVVANDSEAAASSAWIVYNSASGGLSYNANGSAAGFGDVSGTGGLFSQLWGGASGTSHPALTAEVFEIV